MMMLLPSRGVALALVIAGLVAAAVPEPASCGMLVIAGVSLAAAARRSWIASERR